MIEKKKKKESEWPSVNSILAYQKKIWQRLQVQPLFSN
jgi:hypothetical protein